MRLEILLRVMQAKSSMASRGNAELPDGSDGSWSLAFPGPALAAEPLKAAW